MENNNRPHSREQSQPQGTVSGHKGESAGTGPVGSGGRAEQERPSSQGPGRAGGSRGVSVSPFALLGIFALFSKLPKKVKKLILIALAVLALVAVVKGALSQIYVDPTPINNDPTPSVNPTPSNNDPTPTPSNNNSGTVTPTGKAREKRFKALGGGKDTVTIMVYMCGTDLESKYGMATNDLVEMYNATIGNNVNLIVETGGCKKWRNNVLSSSSNQIYRIVSGGIETRESNFGNKSMVDPSNLTDFIKYCKSNFPANRNILIFWDHGGGSITGYGYDEKKGGNDSMDLAEIDKALGDAGVIFDWIGFDTCLLATLETDLVCTKYADYIIASEETEPGTGWYYTNWLTTLSKNTSIDTETLGAQICDDFLNASRKADRSAMVTLSCVDLAKLEGVVPELFNRFSTSTASMLESNSYRTVSNARATTRSFAEGNGLDQIDLADFCDRIGTSESKVLAEALRSCVTHNSTNISRANGISIYFPYESMRSMNAAVKTYDSIGLDSEYTRCIKTFASMASGGQIAYSGSNQYYGQPSSSYDLGSILSGSYSNPLGSLLGEYTGSSGSTSSGYSISASDILSLLSQMSGRSAPSAYSWLDTGIVSKSAQYISENFINPGEIVLKKGSDGKYRVTLTDEQWAMIESVELNVYLDDGKGFIDLGLDNTFTLDGNDLVYDYNKAWITVSDGTGSSLVAYYMTSDSQLDDGTWVTRGRIPANLTRKDADTGEDVTTLVNLEVVFDKDNPDGVITGWRPFYEDNELMFAKGNMELQEGDILVFLCDYYKYDGTYDDTYTLGTKMMVGKSGLKLGYSYVTDVDGFSVTFRLTDCYGNKIWTPAVEY